MALTQNINNQNPGLKHYAALLLAFFAVTFIIYLPSLHAKFVADFIDMVFDIQRRPPLTDFSKGILFDFVPRAVFQLWLRAFGYNVWAWHVLQCGLHAVNAVLLCALLQQVFRRLSFGQPFTMALVTACCFLLNPYHTEPVVWGGDLNYLLVACFIFLHLLAFTLFTETHKKQYAGIALVALIAGAFTHELAWFILPADFLLVCAFSHSFKSIFSGSNLKFWGAGVVLMALYFGNKLLSGRFLGHYGSTVHLRFKLHEIAPAFYKYVLKILLLGGFFPSPVLNKIYGWLDKPVIVVALTCVVLIIAGLLLSRFKKTPAARAPVLFFLLFALFIFPVLNLYFPYWIKIEGDRYCYITSAFLLASAIAVLYMLRPVIAWMFGAVYLAASVYFLLYNIESWHQAGVIITQLESEYKWKSSPQVYILNLPDDYRGAYIYRSLQEPNAFTQSFIKYGAGMPNENNTTAVLGYNLNTPTDSVNVEVTGKDELKVTLSVWGNWFWRQTNGATDYETPLLKVHVDEYKHAYTVMFKHRQPGDVVLYCANGHWRQVTNF